MPTQTRRTTGTRGAEAAMATPDLRIVPTRHPVRAVLVLLVLLVLAWLVVSIVTNENMQWDVVREYMFATPIIEGLRGTIVLTVVSMAIGIVLGTLIAAVRLSPSSTLRNLALGYVNLMRSVPLLVQLIFWYNIALLFPTLRLGIPFTDLQTSIETNSLVTAFVASIIGLSLHESALMAEIVRGGILSVPRGQAEAARTLGMPESKTLFRIILPQAMRAILPATGNQLINLMKATAMVAFIAGGDLMTAAQTIYSRNFMVIPLLIVVTTWYLVLTLLAGVGQHFIERRFGRGFQGAH